jgi:hypothetical protein
MRRLHAQVHRIAPPAPGQLKTWSLLPAMSCRTIVLPGERTQVDVDWESSSKAAAVAHKGDIPLVLLPAVDGVAVNMVRTATLVEIENLFPSLDDHSWTIAVRGVFTANVSLQRRDRICRRRRSTSGLTSRQRRGPWPPAVPRYRRSNTSATRRLSTKLLKPSAGCMTPRSVCVSTLSSGGQRRGSHVTNPALS